MVQPSQPDHEKEKIDRLRQAMYSRTLSEKLHDRERRTFDQGRPMVGDDWKREETNLQPMMTAPRGLGVMRGLLWWILGSAVIFFLGAGGFFLYYFTVGSGSIPASPQNVDIVVSGPPQVPSGEPTELQIAVVNRNSVPLQLADLVVSFPKGTRSPVDFATDEPTLREPLGSIEPGGRRQGTVSAVFAGAEGGHDIVKVEVEYHVNGSNAIFVANNNYVLNFSSAPVALTVDGNTQTVAGQPVQLTVTLASNANAPIKDALLSASYPYGFKFSSATPAPLDGQTALWSLGDVNPGQKKTMARAGCRRVTNNNPLQL